MMSQNPPEVADLDELLAESTQASTKPASDFDDLDSLLDESMAGIREREQYQADLKARQRNFHGMSKEEIDFCNSRMAAFEAARIWQTDDAIEIWQQFHCTGCGQNRFVFSRLMEHQTSRHNATLHRWITVAETKWTGPCNPVKEIREVPVCVKCTEWDLDPRAMTDLKEILG